MHYCATFAFAVADDEFGMMKVCPQWRLSWMIDILSAELQMVLQLMRRSESPEVSPGVSSGSGCRLPTW